MTTNTIVSLRAAILEAAKVLSENDSELAITLGVKGEDLCLSFDNDDLPSVAFENSLTATMVALGEEVVETLENASEEARSEFIESFESDLNELRDMVSIDEGSTDWENTLDSIISEAQNLKRRMDTTLCDRADEMNDAMEELKTALVEFQNSIAVIEQPTNM